MDNKENKIWNDIFGNCDYAFDFANELILREEFNTNSQFSWNIDFYDYNDDEIFIASKNLIKTRNKQPVFTFKENRYIVTKNPNSSYSIIKTNEIIDNASPLNFDLYLSHKINNFKNDSKVVVSINFRKMNEEIEPIFISYLQDVIGKLFQTNIFKFNNENILKNKISFLISQKVWTSSHFLIDILKLNSIIQLTKIRLEENFSNIWLDEDFIDDNYYFNIFIFLPEEKNKKSIFLQNELNFINYVETLDNKIFINNLMVEKLNKLNLVEENEFAKTQLYDDYRIYEYRYSHSEFYRYVLNIIKNKK